MVKSYVKYSPAAPPISGTVSAYPVAVKCGCVVDGTAFPCGANVRDNEAPGVVNNVFHSDAAAKSWNPVTAHV